MKNDFSPPKQAKQYLGMACLFLLGFLQPYLTYAQTFNGTTGAIPDPGIIDFTANVTGLLGTIGTDYTIANVTINIQHMWDSDLDISLVGPDGTTIINLSDDNGDNDFNYTNTVFTDAASTNITAGFAPFTGNFQPEGPGTLASVFNGSAVNGFWTLRVADDLNLEPGTVLSWSITFQAVNPPVVLNCPVNATASSPCLTQAQLTAQYNAWLATASGSGGCGGVLTNNSPGAPSICSATAISQTVEFTYTSTCAPFITTCQATFTVPAYPDFNGPPNSGATRVCLAQTEQPIPPVINDACGKPITPTGPVVVDAPNPLTCEGTRTYIFTYTDCAGHSHDWSFVWTLDVPTLSVDVPGTFTVPCPSFTPPTYPNTITDACGRPVTVTGPTVFSSPDPVTCEGTKIFTWNLTDCAGNTNTWSWIVTIERNDFTLPANGGSTVACPAAANVVPTPPSKMSECGEPIIPTGPVVSATPTCEGTKTYTWTYTDCEGNSHDWVYTYTIERNDFTVPANGSATVSCLADITTPTPPTVTSNCGETLTPTGPVVVNTPDPLTCAGTRVYTYTYTDCEGNTRTWSFTYTVSPTLPMTITCPANTTTTACLTQSAVNNAFSLWLLTASGTGGCDGVLTNNSVALGGAPSRCGGSRTVTFTYTSSCPPFTTTCQATFTVPTAPSVTLTCPADITTSPACRSQAEIDGVFSLWLASASGSGGCNGNLTNNSVSLGGAPSACGGSRTVTFIYTSTCGTSTTTCQATFTVPAAPTVSLICPTNQTEAFGQTQAAIDAKFAAWLATASGTGGCGGTFTNNNTGAPPATGGSVTVTFTKTSNCAPLTSTCQATFTVSSTPPVVLTCPANATASRVCLTQDQLTAEYNAWLATASGSGGCGGELTHDGATPPSICSATETVKTVTFTYTSTCEPFITTCQRTFTVPAYPDFNPPSNSGTIRVCLWQTEPPTPPQWWDPCGNLIIPTGPVMVDAPDPITCEGTRTFTYTYTDCAGHSHDWSFVWTLDIPSLNVDGAITKFSCPSAPPPTYPNTVTDACGGPVTVIGGPTVTSSPDPVTCEGTKTYTWDLMDCAGNTNTWSWVFIIERNDFTLPENGGSTVACPVDADVVPTPPSKMSECGEPIIPTGPVVTSTPACEGTKTYTWTYTDCAGHSHDWSYIYTIERNPFTVPANGAATVNNPSLATQPVPPVVLSNCGEILTPAGPVVTNSPNPIVCTGTRTYAYTYTDCDGNTAIWSFVYTITDSSPPMLNCSNQTVSFNGQESILLNANMLALATDNCGTPSLSISPSFITCQQVGQSVPVTVTATDANNNTATCTATITVAGLPCGWSQQDNGVNCEDGNGFSYNAATGVYTATSTNCYYASPFTADETAFAQRTLCGNGSITAQVTSISGSALGWAGVVMRESNAAGAKKAQLMTNLSSFSRREFRAITNGQSFPQQIPSLNRYWLRIVRMGQQFTMYVSPNGTAWYFAGTQNIVMNNCIQMGLVVTNYTANSTVTATFAGVSFSGNNAPLTLPGSGAAELAPDPSAFSIDFQVYPNPTSGNLNLDLTQYIGRGVRIETYSLEGKLMQFAELDEVQTTLEHLDLKGLQIGMYLVRVKSEGFPDATRKVVVSH